MDEKELVTHLNMWSPSDLRYRAAMLEKLFPDAPPALHHLFALLPPPGAGNFSPSQRRNFLTAAWALFALTYGDVGRIDIDERASV